MMEKAVFLFILCIFLFLFYLFIFDLAVASVCVLFTKINLKNVWLQKFHFS
jgi:hypothetical protein